MRLPKILAIATILFSIVSNQSLAQRKVTLRLSMQKGTEYVMSTSVNQKINQTIMGMDQGMTQNMDFTYSFLVQNRRRNGDMEVDMTYNRVKFESETPMASTAYDSEDPESEPSTQSMAFAALVDQSLGIEFSNRGGINDITGINPLIERMLEVYGIPEGPQREELRGMLGQQFNEESLKNQLVGLTLQYPEGPVGVGDTWTQRQEINAGFPIVLNTTYTVSEIANGAVILQISSEVASAKGGKPLSINGNEIVYTLSGNQTGTMTVDAKTGWTLSSEMTQDISGTVDMLPNPQVPDGLSWPISIRSDTKMSLLNE